VSLDIYTNEFVSIVGPSGCGKSTLLKIIGGLLKPTSGTLTVDGEEVKGAVGDVGFVFQSATLFPWRNVEGNIMLPIDVKHLDRGQYAQRGKDLISLTGLQGFENKYPFELSGGMQQRVAIARALIHNPSMLLMDEPFGALDEMTRDQMGIELLRIAEKMGKTVLFVTHSIPEAVLLSDRVLVLSQRPAKVKADFSVDLVRPRTGQTRLDAKYADYCQKVRDVLGLA
ncbi:MAG: ABC transporter ATP-binding protein, partial [Nitrososphaerota archaeon]|nr:ABC transporter ATP-binding protein [Nitrososphaerota archaeon]